MRRKPRTPNSTEEAEVSTIISLIPALLALLGITVALTSRRALLAASGAATSAAVLASMAAAAAVYGYTEFAALFGAVGALNVLLGVAVYGDARRHSRAERERARAERTGDLHPDSSRSVRHQIALDNIYGPDYGPDHESEPAR